MENYESIGFTKKTHGVQGELRVQVEDKYLEDFFKSSVIFLLVKGRKVPFFIEGIQDRNGLLVKLEEVDSKEAAHGLTSSEIFMRESDLLLEEDREFEPVGSDLVYEKYIGFLIEDSNFGKIGTIQEIQEFPQQEMAVVLFQENEILIPMHEGLIESIDESGKKLVMNLPEGLINL